MRVFIGIDPGVSGGIAQVTEDGHFTCWEMGSTEKDTWEIFDEKLAQESILDGPAWRSAVIEEVHSMPKQGVTSTFTFGRSYGLLRGFLWASGIPFHKVNPRKWQLGLGIKKKNNEEPRKFKARLREMAQGIAPECKVNLKVADAILLAEYLRRSELGI
jgi:crossover junction endodeoxyribonuclease RuvC